MVICFRLVRSCTCSTYIYAVNGLLFNPEESFFRILQAKGPAKVCSKDFSNSLRIFLPRRVCPPTGGYRHTCDELYPLVYRRTLFKKKPTHENPTKNFFRALPMMAVFGTIAETPRKQVFSIHTLLTW